MGKVGAPHQVKLFFGFIFKEEPVYSSCRKIIEKHFGKIDLESGCFDFGLTDYYAAEMGTGLKKRFLSAERLIQQDKLASVKVFTNSLEKKFSHKNCRLINIDPGILDHAKIILASTKDFYHRVYIGQGIFAEVTLAYQNKTYRGFEWTYPDFKSCAYIDFFKRLRDIYAKQVNK